LIVIPQRCNGALRSGHGGYSAGVFAGLLAGPAEVNLRRPVPLETPLDVERSADGARVLEGETVIADVVAGGELALEVPRVSPVQAREAAAGYRGTGLDEFARCYVCGPDREDAFGVFAARVGDREVVASPWTPPAWVADHEGRARPEHVWAALDCPTYYASYLDGAAMSFLVRLQVRIDAPVAVDEEHVVVAWPLGVDGRKRHAGAAVLDRDGALLAVAQGLLVEPRH
jgi:hypothetical protein